jgi:membrane protein DedA with SNARE-associated domain
MTSPEIPAWLNSSKLSQYPAVAFFLIFFGTWFTEDGTMLASAVLWKKGRLSGELVYWANVLGVSTADLLLYYLGFELSRGLEKPWVSRFLKPQTMDRARHFFRKWGNGFTLVARFVPLLRLPAFAGAGLMRQPFLPFGAIVVGSALAWTWAQMKLVMDLNYWQLLILVLLLALLIQWLSSKLARQAP